MTTSSAVHSQAFAFMSYLQGGVDPRTGQYTLSLDFPEIKSNWLCGPDFMFKLSFNPINIIDSGYGFGWNLNLSQFTAHNSILSLSTGETFKVTGSGTEPAIREKKLDSFHFYNNQDGTYRVVHKSGLIEVLTLGGSGEDRVALPSQIYAPSGHSIHLTYASFRGGQRLQSVRDAQGELLRINRPNDSQVELLLRPFDGPGGTPLARYEMELNGKGWVTKIVLPTQEKPSWRFDYGNDPIRGILCLHEVKTPAGGRETIEYQDDGHPYPNGVTRPNLPRVTRHRTYPGFGQPMMEVVYTYSVNNFLGNRETVSWEDGMDPLYNVPHTYVYSSHAAERVGSAVVRQVDRTFNRFHLLTEEKITQDHCVQLQATLYYAEDKPFAQQPAQFQLPRQTSSSWRMDNDASRFREEVTLSAFDVHGNQLEQVEPNGVRTVHTYYPKEASDGCPADPQGFVRNRKDSTVFPSSLEQPGAPTLRMRLRYLALPALTGSGQAPWLSSESETLQQLQGSNEVELQRTLYAYHDQPGAVFLHGRPASQRTMLNGLTSTTEYAYRTLDSVLAGETVLETIETLTGFDHGAEPVRKVTTREDSLVHGQPLLSYDDNGVKIRSTYDELQRVTSETVSPDDDEFKATRAYTYYLTSLDGQQAQQQVTDVKNVTTRTYFDGLNRPINEQRQNADSLTRADEYRTTWSARYDALQNLIEETQFDWRGEEQVPLTRTFDYDAWGMQCCVTGPDGVQLHEQTDPIGAVDWKGPIQRSWRQGSGVAAKRAGMTVTYVNLFEKPAHIERFDTAGGAISLHEYGYDGLGQTVLEIDARSGRTEYAYDSFGRMIRNTLPDGAVVQRRYALHSAEDLPTEISVNDVVLGRQEFDGLGRMKASTTGGRRQVFSYLPGMMQPDTVTTASQQRIHYQYNPQLSEEPMRRQLPGQVTADYVYDKQNARLVSRQEQALGISRQYFSTGELKSEQRNQPGESHAMHYDYSRLGQLLSYTDVLQQVQSYDYDVAGRLESTQLGSTHSDFSYDELGQTATITTRDSASGQQVIIALEYDDLGREIQRTFDLNGIEQQLTQVYNAADLVERRTLKQGDAVLRDETYGYDLRGRLTLYTCEGSQPPVDPYGKAIARQVFRFDVLDNLTQVLTTATDGQLNRALYRFENPLDPAQLTRVENNAGAPYPAEILLEYDADGHLIHDEEQRVLEYDALGRLTRISGLSGEPGSNLDYDPLDTLVGKDGPEGAERRFYRDGELANRIQGADGSTFVRAAGVVLAEHQTGDVQTPS